MTGGSELGVKSNVEITGEPSSVALGVRPQPT
jgi:hypothetical protein